MAIDKQKRDMDRWVRQQLFKDRPDGEGLAHFEIRTGMAGSKGQLVDEVSIPENATGDSVEMLVDDILSRAQADANSHGSRAVRYRVMAGTMGFSFRLHGEGGEDDEGLGDDAPTEKGLVAQLMRHNEAIMRTSTMASGSVIMSLTKQNASLQDQLQEAHNQRMADRLALEAANSAQHDRDMEALRVSGEESRKDKAFEKVDALFPLIVNKLSGRKALPEGKDGDVVKTLMASFSPEQIQALAPLLTPEQQIMMMTLLKEANEAEKPATPGNGVVS